MSKPNVFSAVRYRDAHAAIDWLVEAFGFERLAVHTAPDGTVGHGELRLGTGVLMVSDTRAAADPANPWSSVDAGIYVALDDPDAHHARAAAGGAEIVLPLRTMDYGAREYTARDREGNLWAFGTYNPSPDGAPDFFPSVRYDDGPAALAFLESAFGFRRHLVIAGPERTIAHAELALGTGIVMLGSSPDDPAKNPWAGVRHGTSVALPSASAVDAHHRRAAAAGARVLQAPFDTDYGAHGYSVLDVEGRLWTFGTYRP